MHQHHRVIIRICRLIYAECFNIAWHTVGPNEVLTMIDIIIIILLYDDDDDDDSQVIALSLAPTYLLTATSRHLATTEPVPQSPQ